MPTVRTAAPSLRRRVIIGALGLLAALLLLLGIAIDLLIGTQARHDLHGRMMAGVARAMRCRPQARRPRR